MKKNEKVVTWLHDRDYFYTRYSSTREMAQDIFNLTRNEIESIIVKEYNNIEINGDKNSMLWKKWFA